MVLHSDCLKKETTIQQLWTHLKVGLDLVIMAIIGIRIAIQKVKVHSGRSDDGN